VNITACTTHNVTLTTFERKRRYKDLGDAVSDDAGDSYGACEDGADDQHDLSNGDTIPRIMCG
jgi:hypothetical protein